MVHRLLVLLLAWLQAEVAVCKPGEKKLAPNRSYKLSWPSYSPHDFVNVTFKQESAPRSPVEPAPTRLSADLFGTCNSIRSEAIRRWLVDWPPAVSGPIMLPLAAYQAWSVEEESYRLGVQRALLMELEELGPLTLDRLTLREQQVVAFCYVLKALAKRIPCVANKLAERSDDFLFLQSTYSIKQINTNRA